jgi:hypothetical protein
MEPQQGPEATTTDDTRMSPFAIQQAAESLDERTKKMVLSAVARGQYSRAARYLSAAKVAPFTDATFAALQSLHPNVPRTIPTPPNLPPPPTITPEAVLPLLRSAKRGSAPGPTGLRYEHLLGALQFPANELPERLADLLNKVASGDVPDAVRPYLYGGRALGLFKDTGAVKIRPITIGEVIRRAASKFLSRAVGPEAARILSSTGQLGIAVGSGVDAAFHGAGRYAERARVSDAIMLKVDFQNAFNMAHREAMLAAIVKHVIVVALYFYAAYGIPTYIFFSDKVILSTEGSQQGDGLGGLGWGVLFHESLATEFAAEVGVCEFRAGIADDFTFGGLAPHIRALLTALSTRGPPLGLFINPEKCEVIALNPATVAALFPEITAANLKSFDAWDLLGAPIGSQSHIDEYMADVTTHIVDRHALMRFDAPHETFAFAQYTCGFALGGYLLRMMGPSAATAWSAVDADIRATFGSYVRPVSDIGWEQATIPSCGVGIKLLTPHAAAAHYASLTMASTLADVMCPTLSPPLSLAPPQHLLTLLLPELALQELSLTDMQPGRKLQKTLSKAIDAGRKARFLSTASPQTVARVMSCSGQYASAFLVPLAPTRKSWLTSSEFCTMMMLRLGEQLLPEPSPCALCLGNAMVDVLGHHSCTCMEGGDRTRLHNSLVDAVHTFSSHALLGSRREQCPFPLHPHLRLDGILTRGVARPVLTDQACIFPLAASHLLAASHTPGGAATAYEATKVATYGAAAVEANFSFVPLVVELFGSWGESAMMHLRFVASAWGRQRNLPAHRAIPQVFAALSLTLQRGLARILLKNEPRG